MKRRTLLLLAVAVVVYLGGYLAFRATRSEVWSHDGRSYVIFPANGAGQALYYAWRPLSYADAALTGRQAHIGPHQLTGDAAPRRP